MLGTSNLTADDWEHVEGSITSNSFRNLQCFEVQKNVAMSKKLPHLTDTTFSPSRNRRIIAREWYGVRIYG